MNAWETDDEYASAAQRPLPTPVDTPSRNSSRHSRRSRRKKSVSPLHASSPGPIPHAEMHNRRESRGVTTDENISILDPRRFTPTLHANLVAEILNLRRDQEEKIRAIEGLEETLHASKGEVEELSFSLSTNAKENRSLKRQLALLEGGTSNALGELARERDEAVESISDIKKRLDASQKKVRAQEVDSDRVHSLWAQDKDSWDDERRKLERKVHVAEGRLKTVLDEVAAYQASHPMQESEAEELGGHGSDTASVRSMSMTNSVRFSMLPNNGSKLIGMSLADELDFGDDDELSQMYPDGHESVLSNTHGPESVLSTTHRRNLSRDSMISRNHKHTQSIESVRRPGSVVRGRVLANQSVLEKLEGRIAEGDETLVLIKPDYVDSSTQYSPSISASSPAVLPDPAADPQLRQVDNSQGGETEANQRRKRVRASTPVPQVAPNAADAMVSSACQTVDEPLSPPRTPTTPTSVSEVEKECMISISTQTEGEWALVVKAPPVPPTIPSISIHPPTSRPATPKESLLPQYFKDVACQVSMQVAAPYSSASVQTEEIRVDKRLNLLPVHLQPSSISSCPPSPEPSTQPAGFFTPGVVPPPRNPRRKKSNQSIGEPPSSPPVPMRSPPAPPMSAETHDSYPGNNDDGPISTDKGIRRPPRISSLFAGFENVSSDDADDFADGDLSDSDFRTALSAPRPRKSLNRGKRTSMAPTSVPEDEEPAEEAFSNHVKKQARPAQGGYDANGEVIMRDNSNTSGAKSAVTRTIRQFDKPLSLVMPPARPQQTTMRRAALISNGIAAHQGRTRSPSLPDTVKEPPFPIPRRASSRKTPFSASAPSDGSRSPTREPWSRRSSGRGHHRINSIRKVRSAAALPHVGGRSRRRGSRSPPPFSPSTEAPESPQLPPMPHNEITSPYMEHRDNRSSYGYSTHRKQPSNTTANTVNTQQSAGSSVQATSVVDAIAQTMVGEWMFKYVRRRKSFGVPESGALDSDASNGVRHKRWVWLAPYERAVMWSSRQPTSGPALMGKSGRKLTIQSVLDVKDDNAAPKGVNNLFNRSILILTPARALKFTATSRERHYIWLTALSFLAHSSQAIPEVMAPHPPPIESGNFDILRQNGARLQKHPIRDSIRLAKGRTTLATQSGPTTAQSSIHRGEYSIRTDTSTRGGASTTDHSVKDIGAPHGGDGFVPDAADPPIVPRFTDRALISGIGHGRKRSNTGSRIPPPLSFRGFSERGAMSTGGSSNGGGGGGFSNYGHAPAGSTAGMSVGTNGSSDIYTASQRSSSVMGGNSISFSNGLSNNSNRTSIRTSDASSRPGAVVNNFFEAVGTVRMEAFISPLAFPRSDNDYPVQIDDLGMGGGSTRSGANRRRSNERRRRTRNRDSYYGRGRGAYGATADVEDWYGGSRTAGGGGDEGGGRDDPFRGF
ncbi:hypothetical protein GMDG_02487 [Pseudogymnoascus destructans 20631-21]|uniref:Pleckstrin homology domain-containing protein n=1 Tax=Pseudogymnoascus destructans (strain ATCC MYA-4855 / 20631-21) TaxID=658429 RepID=L8G2F5_PSED2|nr:hypothetical protein GMDG_02487 [Pseudogymnoascus destructans 20631-21]